MTLKHKPFVNDPRSIKVLVIDPQQKRYIFPSIGSAAEFAGIPKNQLQYYLRTKGVKKVATKGHTFSLYKEVKEKNKI